jgi:hypothetical protein
VGRPGLLFPGGVDGTLRYRTVAVRNAPTAGSVAVAGVLGLGSLTGWFGAGEAAVGDCIQLTGETDFEVVDCDGDTAEYRVVGVEDEQQTYPAFMADLDSCAEFATTEVALWQGSDMVTEKGSVYCAEAV